MAQGYKLGGAEPKKLFMGFRTSQVVILAIGVMLGFIAVAANQLLLVLVIFGFAVAIAFLPFGGRNLDEWIPIFARWTITGSKGRQHHSVAPLLGHTDKKSQMIGPPPFLKGVKLLKVVNSDNREIAVIKDAQAGTYSGVLQISGGSFVLSSSADQEVQLANWGSVLARFSREGSLINRVQWIERAIPENSQAMHEYFDGAAALGEDNLATQSYLELIDSAAPITTSHEVFLVIQISQLKCAKQIKQAGGGDDGACEVLIRELTHAANQVASAGFNVLKVLNRDDAVRLIRTSFEPDVNEELVKKQAQGYSMNEIWPVTTETEWDLFHSDGSFHRTFWISDFPRTEVGADFLSNLMLQSQITRTVSVVMEPLSPTKALHEVEVARTSFLADQDIRDKAGYVTNATRQREFEKLQQREQELADGHGAYRFSAYLTCSAPDEESLEYASQALEQAAHQSHLVLRTLYGEQDNAFATRLPFGRGLV